MGDTDRTDFDDRAATWDDDPGRVRVARDVARAIVQSLSPTSSHDVLDVGCGSGLVTLQLQPFVRTILGVDGSEGMLNVLRAKIKNQGLKNVLTQRVDLEHGAAIQGVFHIIISSMMLHHVSEPGPLIAQLAGLLHPGGRLAIADLDKEDGTFHRDNTGVRHFGFDRNVVKEHFRRAGLHQVRDVDASMAIREGQAKREFPVFLVIGEKMSDQEERAGAHGATSP